MARRLRLPLTPPLPAGERRRRKSRPQVLVEPIERVLPGFFGCCVIVTGRRVVVEAVIGTFVDMSLVRHLRRGEGGIERGPSVGDARVELAILSVDRRLDLGRL